MAAPTLHDRATQAYTLLAKRIKTHGNSLDKMALEVIRDAMLELKKAKKPKRKREKVTGIEPLHRELIMCINKTPPRTDHRDKSEMDAYKNKIKGIATAEEVAMLREFYALPDVPQHKYHPQLSKRKSAVVTIMNHYREQVDTAELYFAKNPRKGTKAKNARLEAPADWRARAIGPFQSEDGPSWDVFWQNYNAEAKKILNGEDLSE